jgi:glycosyltransferase AglD
MYRKSSAIVIPTVIGISIVAFMLFTVWDDLLIALQNSIPAYLLIGTMICFSAWWLRGWRYHIILKNLNYVVTIAASTACIFVSQTVNLIVPARLGDIVRVFILKHEYSVTYSEGVSSLVVERVFDVFTVALLGAVAIFFVANVPAWFYTIIVLPLVVGVIFFIVILFMGKLTSENRYITIILTILHEIKRASLSLKAIGVLGISSVLIWLLDVLVCVSVVMMFQQQIPLAVVVLAVVIGNLVKAIPLTPGGVGTYEISLAITFRLAGVEPAVATLIAIIDHLIKNLVTLAGGIVSIYYFGDWVIPSIRKVLDSKQVERKNPDE